MSPDQVPVVILCGGEGTRFRKETQYRPKPLIEIGSEPILLHIMRSYASFGFRRFILCLGYRGFMVKEFFLTHSLRVQDLRLDLSTGTRTFLNPSFELDWEIAESQDDAKLSRRSVYNPKETKVGDHEANDDRDARSLEEDDGDSDQGLQRREHNVSKSNRRKAVVGLEHALKEHGGPGVKQPEASNRRGGEHEERIISEVNKRQGSGQTRAGGGEFKRQQC